MFSEKYIPLIFCISAILSSCGSSHVNGVSTDDLEKAFSDYAVMLDEIGIDKARSAVSRLYSRAEAFEKADTASVLFETLCGLAEKYFYDPNSPFRNIASLDRHRTQSRH